MPKTSEPRLSEFDLIARLFAPLAMHPGAFGLNDDAAIIPSRTGFDLVVSTDTVVEGVDFIGDEPAASVAKRALRVNLSDLAAKGAQAAHYLLSLSLPAHVDGAWLEDFARGLAADQDEYEIGLIGGDTGSTPGPLSIGVTVFGYVPDGAMIRRNGARAGDAVYVTGHIGDSGGGLAIAKGEGTALAHVERDHLLKRYRVPAPHMKFGIALRGIASAALDVSDGLIADLGHIAAQSGVKIIVNAHAIPRSASLRALWGDGEAAIIRAATVGDDYEIAFTVPAAREAALLAAIKDANATVTRIGYVERGRGIVLLDAHGEELTVSRPGWRHF